MVGVFIIVLVAIAAWIATHRGPPVALVGTTSKCDEEEAAVQAAKAALKAAQDKLAPLDAARNKLQAAQKLNDEKQAESLKQNRAAGAQMGHITGSSEGKTIDKTTWSYKDPKLKPAAEKARAQADAAAAALAEAQKAFDALGGQAAWYAARSDVTAALAKLDAAETALARCMGIGEPKAVPPTTTDGGGGTTGGPGVATPGDGPTTQEKPKCRDGEKRTVTVCSGTVTENVVGSLKLVPSSFFESGEGVRDLLNKFRQVDAAIDMAGKVKDAFTNPIGSLIDTATSTGRKMNKLPPASPSGYVDLMKGALVDGIDDLTHKLDDFHGTITDLMAAWQVNTYTYEGKVTCECKGGQMVVVDRSFTVDFKPPAGVGRRELSSGGSSGMITRDDVGRVTGMLLRQLVNQNAAAEQTLVDMQKKVDDSGCGA